MYTAKFTKENKRKTKNNKIKKDKSDWKVLFFHNTISD